MPVGSLLQSIQQKVGKVASRIAAPQVHELPVALVPHPTIGWLPTSDYGFASPRTFSLPIPPRPDTTLASLPLLRGAESAEVSVGQMRGRERASLIENLTVAGRFIAVLQRVRCKADLNNIRLEQPTQSAFPMLRPASTLAMPLGEPAGTAEWAGSEGEGLSPAAEPRDIPLLGAAETEELRAKLLVTAAWDRLRCLTIKAGVYGNLHCQLTPSRDLCTADCLALLALRSVVSDDLHKPLSRRARADGKRYTVTAQPSGKSPVLDKLETPPLAFVGAGLGNRKAFEHERGRVTRGLCVWDLLFPLLQCPVNLEFGKVIDLPSNLYPYQTKGVEFLVDNNSGLLGDDMGTGKTVQTTVAMRLLFQTGRIRTALIVCPLSVVPNWDRELAKWAGNLAVTVARGDKEHRKICWRQAAHVWIVTYDTLRNDIDHVLLSRKGGFDLVVLDEAQRVKNWNAGSTRAVRSLRASYRWGLSGTPLENNTEELWTILSVLKPDIAKAQLDWSEGIRSVLRPMFLRRRKQDVLTDLPPLVQNPVWLRLDEEQRRSYDKLEQQGVLDLHAKGESITAQIIIVLLNKLKQVCNRCPRSGESSKLAWLRDSLEAIVAEDDKVLVFSQYTDERFAGADWLEKELAEFGALNYSKATSDKQRKALLAAFKEKPEHRVFVGHPKTAGLGLNELVVANYVVHFDHWWNPAVMNQATARAHRPGQTKTVFAYDLWVEETYEEIIFKLLEQKQELYNEIVDSVSVGRKPEDSLAFAVADTLFAKYGLKPVQRKQA